MACRAGGSGPLRHSVGRGVVVGGLRLTHHLRRGLLGVPTASLLPSGEVYAQDHSVWGRPVHRSQPKVRERE